MTPEQQRKNSTSRNELRFTVGIMMVTLLVLNAGGWILYAQAKQYMADQNEKRLVSVGRAIAGQIDLASVAEFLPGDEFSGAYASERDRLLRMRDEADLDNISLFVPYQGSLLDTRPGIGIGDFHPLNDIDRPELRPLWEGAPVGLPLYEVNGEPFQSAFIPVIKGSELAAVLALDASAHFLSDLDRLKTALYAAALLSLILAGGLGYLVHRNTKSILTLHTEIKNQEKLAALGTLTAGLAHEIRNPLGIIRASAELLHEEEKEKPHVMEFGKEIMEEVDRLSELLTNFLQFAKPGREDEMAGDLSDLVTEILDRVQKNFDDQHVALVREVTSESLRLRMDSIQIGQVVLNLVLNARDAVNGDGLVSISVKRTKRPRDGAILPAGGKNAPAYAEVSVRDNGCGMTRSTREKLFDPFYSTKSKGTGLGLSIVHGIIQGHEGYLFIDSEEGRGTEIGFGLPLAGK